jgi:hypothetical protein
MEFGFVVKSQNRNSEVGKVLNGLMRAFNGQTSTTAADVA